MSSALKSGIEQYHRRLVLDGAKKPVDRLIVLLLLPCSIIFGIVTWLRGKAYEAGVLPSYRPPVPVVSVGNIAVGGTGKTPVVDWLVKRLIEEGRRPAIVSRGYGGAFSGKVGVVSSGRGVLMNPTAAGDEPCLLAHRNPAAVVLIARRRSAAVRAAVENHGVDVVVLDDGFQHRAVQRDIDLVLIDGARPVGNGWPLPAGLLREFPGALRRADLCLMTRAEGQLGEFPIPVPVWKSRHHLTDYAIDFDGQLVPLTKLAGKRILAFAGIALPDGFFSALEKAGLVPEKTLRFGDHEEYAAAAIKRIISAAAGMDLLLTTEKDGVKLTADLFPVPCYQVPMDIRIENEAEFKTELFGRLWSEK